MYMPNEMIHWSFLLTISFFPEKGVATPHEYLLECYLIHAPQALSVNDVAVVSVYTEFTRVLPP